MQLFPRATITEIITERQRSAVLNAQEFLDHLIDQHIFGGKRLSLSEGTIAPMLTAAKMLVQLQEIAIPPEFAHHVEVSIRVRIHNLSWR